MATSIGKLSKSFFIKLLVGIIILPFVFWGMGDVFRGGNQNVIASIGSEPNDPVPNGTSRLLTFYNSDAGRNLVVRDNLLQFIHNNPPKLSLKKARKLTFARVGDILEAAGIGLLAARFQPGHNALLSNLIFL